MRQELEKQEDVRNLNLDYIICSPLYRTRQTCNLINVNDVEVIYDKRLVERDSKSMQYKSDSELDLDLWYDYTKDVVYGDAEGFKSICTRVYQFLDEITEKFQIF